MIRISKIKGKNILDLQKQLIELQEINNKIIECCADWGDDPQSELMYDIKYILRKVELIYRNLTNCRLTRNISKEESKRRSEFMKKNRYVKSK